MAEQRKLTIEPSYCENWKIKDAIREIIQNAVDTGSKVSFLNGGKFCCVSDKGTGLKLSDFLLGRSSKRGDESTIGQFGEGLKIGCLVLARNNRAVKVRSNGKEYQFTIQHDTAWDSNLLTIDIDDYPIYEGTEVHIECSLDELNASKEQFLQFQPKPVVNRQTKACILNDAGNIYVNGLRVTHIDSLFGYDFKDKTLVNRDRDVVGRDQLNQQIGGALSATTNLSVIERLVQNGYIQPGKTGAYNSMAEYNIYFSPKMTAWRKVIYNSYGKRVVLSSHNPKLDLRALEDNWKVLDFPYSLWSSLSRILPKVEDVLNKKTTKLISQEELTQAERDTLKEAKTLADNIADEAGIKTYPVRIFEVLIEETYFHQSGEARNSYVMLRREDLKKEISHIVHTLLHEYAHKVRGSDDNTREFECDLGDIITTLGIKLIEARKNRFGVDGLFTQDMLRQKGAQSN